MKTPLTALRTGLMALVALLAISAPGAALARVEVVNSTGASCVAEGTDYYDRPDGALHLLTSAYDQTAVCPLFVDTPWIWEVNEDHVNVYVYHDSDEGGSMSCVLQFVDYNSNTVQMGTQVTVSGTGWKVIPLEGPTYPNTLGGPMVYCSSIDIGDSIQSITWQIYD